jgi:3-methyladenine DNA glycosylase AlkC
MSGLLKNTFNEQLIVSFSEICAKHIENFDSEYFLKFVFDVNWIHLELKPRIKHIAAAIHDQLTENTLENLKIITSISENIRNNQNKQDTFEYLFLCDYIEVYGLQELEASLESIEKVTVLASCEFAIRPFLLKYPKETFAQLMEWSYHPHASVRRLASEGCRPKLPWGMGLPFLKKNPNPIYPILENLKDDPSLYVRRSVANNINDISKDHPKDVLKILHDWNGFSGERNWLVKRAARTLLKKGDTKALRLFGYGNINNFEIIRLKLQTKKVIIGSYLIFYFSVTNKSKSNQKIRLEYFIHFLLANGSLSKKVFKISEREMNAKETLHYERRHSFKIISTRKYYTGSHKVSLVINGIEMDAQYFKLIL